MRKANGRLLGGRRRMTAIEFSMIASLVAVVIVGGLQTIGPSVAAALVSPPVHVAAR